MTKGRSKYRFSRVMENQHSDNMPQDPGFESKVNFCFCIQIHFYITSFLFFRTKREDHMGKINSYKSE